MRVYDESHISPSSCLHGHHFVALPTYFVGTTELYIRRSSLGTKVYRYRDVHRLHPDLLLSFVQLTEIGRYKSIRWFFSTYCSFISFHQIFVVYDNTRNTFTCVIRLISEQVRFGKRYRRVYLRKRHIFVLWFWRLECDFDFFEIYSQRAINFISNND